MDGIANRPVVQPPFPCEGWQASLWVARETSRPLLRVRIRKTYADGRQSHGGTAHPRRVTPPDPSAPLKKGDRLGWFHQPRQSPRCRQRSRPSGESVTRPPPPSSSGCPARRKAVAVCFSKYPQTDSIHPRKFFQTKIVFNQSFRQKNEFSIMQNLHPRLLDVY